jgi:hypothetical protein
MKLTSAQEIQLRILFEQDPEKVFWTDVLLASGNMRNPTRQRLAHYGLIRWEHFAGNSFKIRLTEKGVH